MVDLLDYLRGAVGPDGVNGKPVGVRHKDNASGRTQDGINQVQRDGNTRRWMQVKGAWNNPPPQSDWEELWYDDAYIYRAVDTSRKPEEGGPYTLTDTGALRGSKWIKRHMNVGEKFFRNPTIYPFNMATGVRSQAEGQAPTWIKLAVIHPTWQGINDVAELQWLLNENDTTPAERTFYAKGLGQVGFVGSGMTTTPNGVFPDFPPATGIPVLVRKPAPWLPAMPDTTPTPPPPADGFYLLDPCHAYPHIVWSGYGERETPRTDDPPGTMENHHALDIVPGTGAIPPLPIAAAAPGRVLIAGWDTSGYGNLVKLDHGDGRVTLYAHMEDGSLAVSVGDTVTRGQTLGRMGSTGNSTGRHLHLEYRVNGMLMNPTPLMRDTIAEPPVTEPVTPEPEPDTAPAFEIEFDTIDEKNRVGQMLINIGERILSAPGRRISITVRTE